MAKGFFSGLVTATVAAAAAVGVCYIFKDEIMGSKTYQTIDGDERVQKAKGSIKTTASKVKDKTSNVTAKAKETASTVSAKAKETTDSIKAKFAKEDEIIDEDEIILTAGTPAERDYVSIVTEEAEAVTEAAEEATETVAEAVEEAVAEAEEAVSEDAE